MIAIGLLAVVLSGLLAKFVSLGSAPLVVLMALIAIDLVDSRSRRRTSWRFGWRQFPGDVAPRGCFDGGDEGEPVVSSKRRLTPPARR